MLIHVQQNTLHEYILSIFILSKAFLTSIVSTKHSYFLFFLCRVEKVFLFSFNHQTMLFTTYLQFVHPSISSIDRALFQILTSVMSPECCEQSELLCAHRPTYMMSKKFEGTSTFFKRSSTKLIFVTWPSWKKST